MTFFSPLRYPGGKRRLANFIKTIYHVNNLLDGDYIEPYAGGASVALSLLFDEYARFIHINDLDYLVYAFWYSVLNLTDDLCRKIIDTPINMETWQKQKKIFTAVDSPILDLGFSTFFLNRTNRSGILTGGVIGGKLQNTDMKLDVRFNKNDLIQRIEKIARFRNRIKLYNLDSSKFLVDVIPTLSDKAFIYLDPPYYLKGTQMLYSNYYEPNDHYNVSNIVRGLPRKWIISYDNVPQVKNIYSGYRFLEYDLNYSAQQRYKGAEIIYFCNELIIPNINNPIGIKNPHSTNLEETKFFTSTL